MSAGPFGQGEAIVTEVSEASLTAHARQVLAPYKRPKRYGWLEDLPRTATGKVQRNQVARALEWH